MTHDGSHSYTYDAENRITQVDGGSTATYVYGADGRRVSRVVAGVETDYTYDLSGHVVADYGGGCGATCWRVGYVYLNGEPLAEYFGGTYFYVTDHLGSTRLLTGYPTASVVECDDYYPFGEQISCGGTSTTTHKFTGYERDSETNLDNAQARYNSSSLGRFMSPDPLGNFVADATNPQTWNMYAYVNNNPLAFTDPTGTDPGACEWSNAAACEADNNLGDPSIPFPCDVQSGCIAYVNGNTPTWDQDPNPPQFPVDPCSTGGCSPVGGGGGGTAGTCYYVLASPCGSPQTSPPPPTSAKKPCTPPAHDPKAKGVDTLLDAFHRVTHPLEMVELNEIMAVVGGGTAAIGGGAVALACGHPDPFEPFTCAVGVAAGVPTAAGGVFLMKQSMKMFKNYTLPALKDWGCHE